MKLVECIEVAPMSTHLIKGECYLAVDYLDHSSCYRLINYQVKENGFLKTRFKEINKPIMKLINHV